MTTSSTDFTTDGYVELIGAFRMRDYSLVGFDSVQPEQRHLILRHDVDFDLDAAVTLARAEAANQVCATYFVLLRSEFYNVLSQAGTRAVRALLSLGHTVGLHVDSTHYEPSHASGPERRLSTGVAQECAALEDVIGAPVRLVSFHRPGTHAPASDDEIAGRLNTYGRTLTERVGYCSDSRGHWQYGHPLQHDAVTRGRALQLLTHPIWWVGTGPQSPRQRLLDYLRRRSEGLKQELARQCSVFDLETGARAPRTKAETS